MQSTLQPELVRVAEVAIREAVEEAKTSNTVETGSRSWYADSSQFLAEAKCWELNYEFVNWKGAAVGAAEDNGRVSDAATQETVVFVEYKVKWIVL